PSTSRIRASRPGRRTRSRTGSSTRASRASTYRVTASASPKRRALRRATRASRSPSRPEPGRPSTSCAGCTRGCRGRSSSSSSFNVGADEYDRFMGRYSMPLAPRFAEFAGVAAGRRVLDVGCGPGALTAELVKRLSADAVWAVDPSEHFVAAVRVRCPGVQVQQAVAEELPFEDELFDTALAQLVVHFMADPVAGLREMARVTRTHGI